MTVQGSSLQPLWKDPSVRPYLGEIARRHGVVEILALDNMRDLPRIRIETLYVPPLLASHSVDPDSDPGKWPEGMNLFATLEKHRRVVVLGDPGGGKTTLANWLAWRLAAGLAEPLPEFLEDMLPIPCVLRELPPELLARQTTPYELVTTVARRLLGMRTSNDLLRKLGAWIEVGRYVLILDGIDEIPIASRLAVRDWVRAASVQGAIVLATSRVIGYDDLPVDKPIIRGDESFRSAPKALVTKESLATADDAERKVVLSRGRRTIRSPQLELDELDPTLSDFEMEVRGLSNVRGLKFTIDKQASWAERSFLVPFDDSRIAAFAGNWYRQRCSSEVEAREKANDLVAAVSRNATTLRLARTPNLLTLMAVVHRERANLPDGKALLYDEIANAYINTIDTGRRLAPGPDRLVNHDWKERKAWLAYVAFMMQKQRAIDDKDAGVLVGGAEVRVWLAEAMEKSGVTEPRAAAEDYLGWVARRSGLLLPRGEERYAFVHLSFQEYFCACFLVDCVVSRKSALDGLSADETVDPISLAQWARKSAWGEVFVFLFEKLSAEREADWVNDLAARIFRSAKGHWLGDMDEYPDEDVLTRLAARVAIDRHVRLDVGTKEALIALCVRYAGNEWQFESEEPNLLPLLVDAGYACIAQLHEDSSVVLAHQGLALATVGTLDGLESLPNLRLLILTGNQVGDLSALFHLTKLQSLYFHRAQVSDLAPLSGMTGLQSLVLHGTQVSDLSALSGLTSLQELNLQGTQVDSISPLSGLSSLQALYLQNTRVSDLSPLSRLSSLQSLYLQNTQACDLSPLSGLTSLQFLQLQGTQVSDLSPLAELSGLQFLHLQNTQVSDLSPLSRLTGLESLYLRNTQVNDLAPLSGLFDLEFLYLEGTDVDDLSPISGLTNLHAIDLEDTQVNDLSPLSKLTNLFWLDLQGTQVSDLSPLSGLTNLEGLDLRGTQVSDLSPISGLTGLQDLDLQGTQVSDLSTISGLTGLQGLDLRGTQVTDLTSLSRMASLKWIGLSGTNVIDTSPIDHIKEIEIEGLKGTKE